MNNKQPYNKPLTTYQPKIPVTIVHLKDGGALDEAKRALNFYCTKEVVQKAVDYFELNAPQPGMSLVIQPLPYKTEYENCILYPVTINVVETGTLINRFYPISGYGMSNISSKENVSKELEPMKVYQPNVSEVHTTMENEPGVVTGESSPVLTTTSNPPKEEHVTNFSKPKSFISVSSEVLVRNTKLADIEPSMAQAINNQVTDVKQHFSKIIDIIKSSSAPISEKIVSIREMQKACMSAVHAITTPFYPYYYESVDKE